MSLSDCSECWESPCVCGHGYKHYSEKRKIELVSAVLGMTESDVANMISSCKSNIDETERKKM